MDNFEEYLKNEAGNFKLQPSEMVWEGVRKGLKKPRRRFTFWYAAAVLLIILSVSFLLNYHTTTPNAVSNNKFIPEQNNIAEHSEAVNKSTKAQSDKKQVHSQTDISKRKPSAISLPKQEKSGLKDKSPMDELVENKTKNADNTNHLSAMTDFISQKNINILPFTPAPEITTLLNTDPVYSNSHINRKFSYSLSVGINLSKPLKTGYENFVKPGINYNFQFFVNYKLWKRLGIVSGIGYQQNTHKIGIVSSPPETINIPTGNGFISETTVFRLNNESLYKNVTRKLIFPIALNYLCYYDRGAGSVSVFTGLDFSEFISARYLIKNTQNDNLFFDNKLLKNFNSYSTFGVMYSNAKNQSVNFFSCLKLQFQNGSTYKSYSAKEHVLISSLNFGIRF